jgi:hypothetical protein
VIGTHFNEMDITIHFVWTEKKFFFTILTFTSVEICLFIVLVRKCFAIVIVVPKLQLSVKKKKERKRERRGKRERERETTKGYSPRCMRFNNIALS